MANEIISEDYIDLLIDNELLPLFKNASYTTITFVNSVVHIPRAGFDKCSLGRGIYAYSSFPVL